MPLAKFFVPLILLIVCYFPILPRPARAEPEQNLNEVLDGFDDGSKQSPDDQLESVLEGFESGGSTISEPAGKTTSLTVPSERYGKVSDEWSIASWQFSLNGYLQVGTTFNIGHEAPENRETDWRGFSRARTELLVDLNGRFSRDWQAKIGAKGFYDAIHLLKGRDDYSRAVRNEYEDELELREVYILGRLSDNLDLKAGRQIVVWGKSDNIRITDVLNPLDLREPGMTDIEDLRLPVTMTKLDYYLGAWNLAAMAIHEIRFNKTPVYGHDFFQADTPPPPADEPGDAPANTEWAFSLSGIFSGWDIDFYYARIFNDTPHLKNISAGPLPEFRQKHARLDMFGVAYNLALGNWLVKTEAAFLDDLKYTNSPGTTYSRLDGLIGLEYSGFKETTVSLEFANRHIYSHEQALENQPDGVLENMYQAALRYKQDFLNDTLTLTMLAMAFGPSEADGASERLSLEYDLNDTVRLRGGAVLYQSGDLSSLQDIGDSDRLFLEIRYTF